MVHGAWTPTGGASTYHHMHHHMRLQNHCPMGGFMSAQNAECGLCGGSLTLFLQSMSTKPLSVGSKPLIDPVQSWAELLFPLMPRGTRGGGGGQKKILPKGEIFFQLQHLSPPNPI